MFKTSDQLQDVRAQKKKKKKKKTTDQNFSSIYSTSLLWFFQNKNKAAQFLRTKLNNAATN
jgi:hypothetical protein